MPKRTLQQEERRLWNSGQAAINKHERIVADIAKNRALQDELNTLRKRYRMLFKTPREQVNWYSSLTKETLINFSRDIEAIKEKFCITEKMNGEFWEAVHNTPAKYKFTAVLGSLPETRMTIIPGKKLEPQLIITPETDMTNEIVIKYIIEWQKAMININDKPPQPQPIKGSKKSDWNPVWEWNRRHPYISRKELAAIMGISYTHLKSRLEAIDKTKDDSIPFSFQK